MCQPSSPDAALRFYYVGFHSALVRYRTLTFSGWVAAALGAAGLLPALGRGGGSDLLAIAVALVALAAGLSLVHQSVAALDEYVRIPFPPPAPGSIAPNVQAALDESVRLMEEIDRGGWQDAYAALGAVRTMAQRYDLPPLP